MVQVAKATGQELPKFEDHTPYSNQGMEDLLKLNELVSATKTKIIPLRSNKTVKACTPLVLMGTSMNVMTEPLHQNDKALPRGLHVHPSYAHTIAVVRRQLSSCITPRTTPLLSIKGLLWPEWWQLMRFLKWWSQIVL